MNIGILGCGRIARTLAQTMKRMEGEGIHLAAFASRSLEKAKCYAKDFAVEKAYGSYEELVRDDSIDLVYLATPHSEHLQNMLLCFDHGKNVLVEKAFTANAEQARQAIARAREKDVFLAEAIWTRYMPIRRTIDELLSQGRIGRIRFLSADLGYLIHDKERLVDPSLAGGSLLDVGVYPLNFALMHVSNPILSIVATGNKHESGVDLSDNITLFHEDKVLSSLTCTMECSTPRLGTISGEQGYLVVENVNNPEEVRLYDKDHRLVERIRPEGQISGYEYELRECRDCLASGKKEAPSMPLSETLRVMEILDAIRAQLGVSYPFERERTRRIR